jgi:hypothetical protein
MRKIKEARARKPVKECEDVKETQVQKPVGELKPEEVQALADKANKFDSLEKEFTVKSQKMAELEKKVDSVKPLEDFANYLSTNPDKAEAIQKILEGEVAEIKGKKDDGEELTSNEKKLLAKVDSLQKEITKEKGARESASLQVRRTNEIKEAFTLTKKDNPDFDKMGEMVVLAGLLINPKSTIKENIEKYLTERKGLTKTIIETYTNEKKEAARQKILGGGIGGADDKKELNLKDGSARKAAVEYMKQKRAEDTNT